MIIVQPNINSLGQLQPMVYNDNTGEIIVDELGNVLMGANTPLVNQPSFYQNITTPKTQTSGIQEAHNAAKSGETIYIRAGIYPIYTLVSFTKDITVKMDVDATIRLMNASAQFNNTQPINLRWYGGIIDCNGQNNIAFWFGGGPGAPTGSSQLTSCIAKEIQFINVYGGAWWANMVNSSGANFNTFVTWKDITATKLSTGSQDDIFELVGKSCKVINLRANPNLTNSFVFTSAFLFDSEIETYTVDANGNGNFDNNSTNNIMLQAYTGNGPYPNFGDVILKGNGYIALANGSLSSLTTTNSGFIKIISVNASNCHIGSSPYDQWTNVSLEGYMLLDPRGGDISINNVIGFTGDVIIDASLLATSSFNGVIQFQASSLSDYVVFKNLIVKNASSSNLTSIIGFGQNTNHFSILQGDITQNVNVPLLPATTYFNYIPLIINLKGYNPQGFKTTTPSVPASGTAVQNTNPYPVMVYISGGSGTAVAITPNGGSATTVNNTLAGQYRLNSGDSITLTYTTAPTWTWYGL